MASKSLGEQVKGATPPRDRAKSLNRRNLVKLAVASAAVLAPNPFRGYRSIAAADKGKVVVASGSGSYQQAQIDAFFKPFTAETGIEVQVHNILSLAEKKAMMETGRVAVDVIGHAPSDLVIMGENGWLEPIDYNFFRKEDLDSMQKADLTKMGLGFFYWAEVLGYRTDIFPTGRHPISWQEFWDVKRFPGARSLGSPELTYSFEFALLADGVPKEKLYPLDIDRAFKSMSKIRKDVINWWAKSAEQPAQLLNDKEIVLASVANGRIQRSVDDGAPIAIEWNEGLLYHQFFSIAKGAKNAEGANKLLAFVARPQPQAKFAELISYGPTNLKAYDFLPEKLARTLPTYPKWVDKMIVKDENWWYGKTASGKTNREIVIERWEEWKLG